MINTIWIYMEYDSDSTSDSIEIHIGNSLLNLLGIITEMKAECTIGIPMTGFAGTPMIHHLIQFTIWIRLGTSM
jgi:hypothetical protein